jgi:predicted oxidoreductase (fatty acid repression mutant protein)
LIDEEVKRSWHLPKEWELIAQMPFGMPLEAPGEKTFKPLEERVKVFK